MVKDPILGPKSLCPGVFRIKNHTALETCKDFKALITKHTSTDFTGTQIQKFEIPNFSDISKRKSINDVEFFHPINQ